MRSLLLMKLLSDEQFNIIQPIIIDTYLNITGGIFSTNGYLEILDVLFDYIYFDEISKKAKTKPNKEQVNTIREIIKDFYVRNLIYEIKNKKIENEKIKNVVLPDYLQNIVEKAKDLAKQPTLYELIGNIENNYKS